MLKLCMVMSCCQLYYCPLDHCFSTLLVLLDPIQSLTNLGPIPFNVISTSRPLRHNLCQHLKLEYLRIRNILQLHLYIVIVKIDYKISNLCNSNDSKAKSRESLKEEKPCVLWIGSTHLENSWFRTTVLHDSGSDFEVRLRQKHCYWTPLAHFFHLFACDLQCLYLLFWSFIIFVVILLQSNIPACFLQFLL